MDNLQSESKPLWWKRVLLWGFSIGFGAVVTLALIIGGTLWYQSRPKAWNKSAITAAFDRIDTVMVNGKNTIQFRYILENHTNMDYEITNEANFALMSKLEDSGSLTSDDTVMTLTELPLFLAARQKVLATIKFDCSCPEILQEGATQEARKAHREKVAKWMKENAGNLNGFVLFDKLKRYQIDFPKGW